MGVGTGSAPKSPGWVGPSHRDGVGAGTGSEPSHSVGVGAGTGSGPKSLEWGWGCNESKKLYP